MQNGKSQTREKKGKKLQKGSDGAGIGGWKSKQGLAMADRVNVGHSIWQCFKRPGTGRENENLYLSLTLQKDINIS